jgi:hypothetical protein
MTLHLLGTIRLECKTSRTEPEREEGTLMLTMVMELGSE